MYHAELLISLEKFAQRLDATLRAKYNEAQVTQRMECCRSRGLEKRRRERMVFPLNERRRMVITRKGKLREIRKARGLTQASIAERIEISRTYYSKIENGAVYPSVTIAYRILRVLGSDFKTCFHINAEHKQKMLQNEVANN